MMTEAMLRRVYKFIEKYLEQQPDGPTLREISEGCNLQMGRVLDALELLEIRGKIEREKGVRRSIRIQAAAADRVPDNVRIV
jgi:hypothetical protein